MTFAFKDDGNRGLAAYAHIIANARLLLRSKQPRLAAFSTEYLMSGDFVYRQVMINMFYQLLQEHASLFGLQVRDFATAYSY
jgi:hypothetical protein